MTSEPEQTNGFTPEAGARKVMDQLAQEARVERWSRMIPAEANLESITPEQLQAAINKIRWFKKSKRQSNATIAKMAGISTSTLSEVLDGKYKANPTAAITKVEAAIAEWFHKRSAPAPGRFVWTQVALEIRGIVRFVTKSGRMGVFVGESGIGKTECMKVVQEVHYPSAIFITINSQTSSPLNFLLAMLRQISSRASRKAHRKADTFGLIAERLRNSYRLILIDEADGLRMDTLNEIRQLHDETGCPVVMAGRPPLLDKIKRSAKDERIGGSVRGRFCIQQNLHDIIQGCSDGSADQMLFTRDEIRAMFAKYQVSLTEGAVGYLCQLANLSLIVGDGEEGGLRYALAVFLVAVETNKGAAAGRGLTQEMMQAANRACRPDIYVATDDTIRRMLKRKAQ